MGLFLAVKSGGKKFKILHGVQNLLLRGFGGDQRPNVVTDSVNKFRISHGLRK